MKNDEDDKTISYVDHVEMDLEGPIYEGVHGRLFIEVRDFYEDRRTLVIRSIIEGDPVTTMVRWDTFVDMFDGMRARMMSPDWDTALAQLTGGKDLA